MNNLPVTRAGASRPWANSWSIGRRPLSNASESNGPGISMRHFAARQFIQLTKAPSSKRQATSTKLRQNAIIRI